MKKLLTVAFLVTVAVVVMPASPTEAGGTGRTIEVTKVVVGPGPDGPYQVEAVCDVSVGGTTDISNGETVTGFPQGAESDTCTFTETTTLGATVSYSCAVIPFGDDGATCDDDNTVSFEGDLTGAARITITNTFQEPTTTTTSTSTTAPTTSTSLTTTTAAAAAVAATPTFTG